jgi:putative iron-regulated protein
MRRNTASLCVAAALAVAACSSDQQSAPNSPGVATTTVTPSAVTPSTVTPSATSVAAGGEPAPTTAGSSPAPLVSDDDFTAVASTYAELVATSYATSLASIQVMSDAVDRFVAAPSQETLDAARQAWLAARDDYGPTEAFRLYDGPIDNPDTGPEGRMNAWPMDEAYVDYVEGDRNAGIINNPAQFPEITEAVLVAANEEGGETNISTGWHAIEFLLWGQDQSSDGPGDRPVSDYTSDANATRRAQYLQLLNKLLINDMTSVAGQWAPDGEYRTSFVAGGRESVQLLLRGIGALSSGELAGERMAVPFETKDQEDEHSCFSDNTAADIANNARGIQMVYLADANGIDGMSPSDLVAMVDPELDATLRAQLDQSVQMASSFPATFEAMIAAPEGDALNTALLDTIVSIEDQGDMIAKAAAALGLQISIEV